MRYSKIKYGILGLVVTLTACVGTIHGGGVVYFFDVDTGNGDGLATDATVAVSVTCNDARDMFRSTFHLTDNTNGANFTASLPWTPVSALDIGISTCEEAAAWVDESGGSLVYAIINSQGQASGEMAAVVGKKGVATECGPDAQPILVEAYSEIDVLPGGYYAAAGCLYKGNIVFE